MDQMDYINTSHPNFIDGSRAVEQASKGKSYGASASLTKLKVWAECLLNMYLKWGEKQGHEGRIIKKRSCRGGGVTSASVEFEFVYAYDYLLGERGIHQMLTSREPSLTAVDVVPLFLESFPDLPLDEEDLRISFGSLRTDRHGKVKSYVSVEHLPTGISVQSCG